MKATVFDTETTDLVTNRTLRLDRQPEVIEFSACYVDLDTGEEIEWLDHLIKPKSNLREKTTKITRITDEMIASSPPFSDVADSIFNFLERGDAVIAHNFAFDRSVMDIEAERLNRTIAWPHGLCSVEQTMWIKGARLKLEDLYFELFKVRFAGAHRARNDVKALVDCCVELRKREAL